MCSKDVDGNGNSSSALSRVSILVGFICALSYFGAFVGTGWVYTKESYRLTTSNLYTSVTFKIGLWRTCHSFKRINSTITAPPVLPPSCTLISYFNWSEITRHNLGMDWDVEPTLNVLTRIRWCTIFIGLGFILSLIAFVYSVSGHFYQDNKTLLASAIYTLSGLSVAAGLFIFVCVLTDSFAGMSPYAYDSSSWSVHDLRRSRDYKYGWCFLTAGVACIVVEVVAVLCITVHYRRCQTIAFMVKNIVPIIEEKASNTYCGTKDTGLLMKTDDEGTKVDSKANLSADDSNSNGLASETPPDICSTFLNADQSNVDVEQGRAAAAAAVAAATTREAPYHHHHHHHHHQEMMTSSSPHKVGCIAGGGAGGGKRSANFATLNTRNYRCLNYPTVRKYSTLGGCSLLTAERGVNSPTSVAPSSSSFSQVHCHQKSCIQSTMPRMKSACVNANKYHTTDRNKQSSEISEMQQLSCDDFTL